MEKWVRGENRLQVSWLELVVGPEGESPASGGDNDQGDKYQQEESLS